MVMWEESRGGETLVLWGYGVERVWGTTIRTGAGKPNGYGRTPSRSSFLPEGSCALLLKKTNTHRRTVGVKVWVLCPLLVPISHAFKKGWFPMFDDFFAITLMTLEDGSLAHAPECCCMACWLAEHPITDDQQQ